MLDFFFFSFTHRTGSSSQEGFTDDILDSAIWPLRGINRRGLLKIYELHGHADTANYGNQQLYQKVSHMIERGLIRVFKVDRATARPCLLVTTPFTVTP